MRHLGNYWCIPLMYFLEHFWKVLPEGNIYSKCRWHHSIYLGPGLNKSMWLIMLFSQVPDLQSRQPSTSMHEARSHHAFPDITGHTLNLWINGILSVSSQHVFCPIDDNEIIDPCTLSISFFFFCIIPSLNHVWNPFAQPEQKKVVCIYLTKESGHFLRMAL